jgi:Biotin protein ligase C terminal domain
VQTTVTAVGISQHGALLVREHGLIGANHITEIHSGEVSVRVADADRNSLNPLLVD